MDAHEHQTDIPFMLETVIQPWIVLLAMPMMWPLSVWHKCQSSGKFNLNGLGFPGPAAAQPGSDAKMSQVDFP